MANEKKIQANSFVLGTQSDPADEHLVPQAIRQFYNSRLFEPGSKGKIKNVLGNTLITNTNLQLGNNLCLGFGKNEEQNVFYWFNWNSNGYHAVYKYDDTNQTVTPIIINLINTNNVDIFFFNPNYLIRHVDIIQDNLIYWVDGLNKARKFNLVKAVDTSINGYGTIISEDFITAYKQTSIYAPTPTYFTDVTRSSNYLYGMQFKFCQRFTYDDGEISNASDFSIVALAPNENYLGADNITYNNNGINVLVSTGNRLVTKIEVLVQMTNGEVILPWQSVIVLNKAQLSIPDNSGFTYAFYNDVPLTPVDNAKIQRPYSFMPRVPFVQSFVKLAMTYGNASEGFSTVQINASVAVTSQDLYLPSGTTTQLNSPAFTVTATSVTPRSAGFLAGTYQVGVTHFIIGHDVKAGNTFVLTGKNGAQDNYYWSYTATGADTATTVASRVKQWLRSTGRGVPDYKNGVSNEAIDGSGNVSWDYTYLGHYNTAQTVWAGSVNPVNYSTLTNNGYSVNVIKSGGSRKYAIVYEDDDGRKSLAYTCDALLAKTPFLTQWGTTTLQQPIHTITINNQPPSWARYWQLVRTEDIVSEIQCLIQNVVSITVTGEGQYLDLIIGSIFTYQLVHPNTVIKYQFQEGDRLRLIKDENSGNLYTPYFETQVLSYKEVVTQIIDSNITCTNGSANVTPDNGVNANYVGMYIIINGIQRLITSISGSDYVLDEPFNPVQTYTTTAQTTAVFPNYTLVDPRGTIRINMPPSAYNVVALSLVEIYHPEVSVNNDGNLEQAQNFQDFSMKFEIANFGTASAAHRGNVQDQNGATPCIVQTTQGDCYMRQRALPTNSPQFPQDVQVIIDTVEDPNASDFYVSNLYSLGRVFPQDDGSGVQNFTQRERFSNDYIQGTKVNGLNDFDDLDRKDYNDNYGPIMLTRFRHGYLKMFKQFKNTWTPIKQNIITDNAGNRQLVTSSELLNDIQYSEWQGGIGARGCYFEYGDYEYISSDNSGVILRGAQNGWEPISSKFLYDKVAREFLAAASNNNLQITGQFDRLNDEATFCYPAFISYLFNSGFEPTQWQIATAAYPGGTTWAVIAQPANSTATVVSGQIQITGTNTLGNDFFTYQGTLPAGGGTTPIMKFCFTVVQAPYRPTNWKADLTTAYCVQSGGGNNGQQSWKVLDQYYTDNNALTGTIMPNIMNISPEAIVPNTATITFNPNTNPTPSGGSDGDVWYNGLGDYLYKKISGVWTPLFDRVLNSFFAPSILNTGSCPIYTPPNNFNVVAQYGYGITSVTDGTTTGVPAGTYPMASGTSQSIAYTTVTAGTIQVVIFGTGVFPNMQLDLYIGAGAAIQRVPIPTAGTYYLTVPTTTNNPTLIRIAIDQF
jgi:hypothetical protein